MVYDKMVLDKIVWTKWYGQKMVCDRMVLDKILCTKWYCIVLYCIVSIHLYSAYIVHLYSAYIVHTNQKRFQYERPREKRAVLRERKEALGSPVNKVDW